MATCLFLSDANLKMADIETEEMKNESSMMIGRRCAVDKHRGTIKFMGEVPPTSGQSSSNSSGNSSPILFHLNLKVNAQICQIL